MSVGSDGSGGRVTEDDSTKDSVSREEREETWTIWAVSSLQHNGVSHAILSFHFFFLSHAVHGRFPDEMQGAVGWQGRCMPSLVV